jgi:hypothetical protein
VNIQQDITKLIANRATSSNSKAKDKAKDKVNSILLLVELKTLLIIYILK